MGECIQRLNGIIKVKRIWRDESVFGCIFQLLQRQQLETIFHYKGEGLPIEQLNAELLFHLLDKMNGTIGAAPTDAGSRFIGDQHNEIPEKKVAVSFHGRAMRFPLLYERVELVFELECLGHGEKAARLVDPHPRVYRKVLWQ